MTDGTDPNGTEPREPQSNDTVASTPEEVNGAATEQPTPLTPPTQSSDPASTSTPAPTATVYTSGAAPSAYATTPPQPAATGYPYIQAPPPKPARERSRSTMPVAATIVVAALARCFKYNGMTLPDIPGMSVEQVKEVYAAQYPELLTAEAQLLRRDAKILHSPGDVPRSVSCREVLQAVEVADIADLVEPGLRQLVLRPVIAK